MKRSFITFLSLAIIAAGCGGDSQAREDACSLVSRAQELAGRELSDQSPNPDLEAVTDALEKAHAAVMGLNERDVRRLIRNCDNVSGVGSATYRGLQYVDTADDLGRIERRLVGKIAEVERKFSGAFKSVCDAFETADETAVRGAIGRLRVLDRAIRLFQEEWTVEQREAFISSCDVELDRDWDAAREILVSIAATEQQQIDEREAAQKAAADRRAEEEARKEAEAARRQTEEMLSVLVEMEQAWNSISRSDRGTVCSLFRQDRVGTAQQWVRLSGYGKPEYAFVFLSEVCR